MKLNTGRNSATAWPLSPMPAFTRRSAFTLLAGACFCSTTFASFVKAVVGQSVSALPLDSTLATVLRNTSGSGVALDLPTDAVLGAYGPKRSGRPGSTLKPILLQYALDHGLVKADTAVFCRRDLHIGARPLPCTHPRDQDVFTAETALAESCNTYFAELARRFSARQLEDALRKAGIPHNGDRYADAQQRELAVLGLDAVSVTPMQLAHAYRSLTSTLLLDGPVAKGLKASVHHGMASNASVAGMTILGKTGTAGDTIGRSTHGWFAGILPGRIVLVIFVPNGDGGSAARLAGAFFAILHSSQAAR